MLAELVNLQEALFAEIDALHVGDVLCRRSADAASDDDGVGLEDDAVVDDLVNGQRSQIVVFNQRAFVDRVSVGVLVSSHVSFFFFFLVAKLT